MPELKFEDPDRKLLLDKKVVIKKVHRTQTAHQRKVAQGFVDGLTTAVEALKRKKAIPKSSEFRRLLG